MALERGQERLSLRKWESGDMKMGGARMFAVEQGWIVRGTRPPLIRLVLPAWSLVLRNSPKPLNQRE